MNLSGNIVFSDDPPQQSCKAYVRVLDTSYADVPSRVVAEQVVAVEAGRRSVFFELMVEGELDERADFSLYVHVDVDGDGRVSEGDYVTMEAYQVATHVNKTEGINVEVKKV